MDKAMIAYCGNYCGSCAWRESAGCPGCKATGGKPFWGECDKASCCMEKKYEHCGGCPQLPCQKLLDFFGDEEHGDDGVRLRNLKNWQAGIETYEMLENRSQRKAREEG